MDELKAFIGKSYRPQDGAKTMFFSEGNYDDVFSDGEARGYAMALNEVAKIIGMEVAPLEEQDFS